MSSRRVLSAAEVADRRKLGGLSGWVGVHPDGRVFGIRVPRRIRLHGGAQRPHGRRMPGSRRHWWHEDHWHRPGFWQDAQGAWHESGNDIQGILKEHYCWRTIASLMHPSSALKSVLDGGKA